MYNQGVILGVLIGSISVVEEVAASLVPPEVSQAVITIDSSGGGELTCDVHIGTLSASEGMQAILTEVKES